MAGAPAFVTVSVLDRDFPGVEFLLAGAAAFPAKTVTGAVTCRTCYLECHADLLATGLKPLIIDCRRLL